MKATNSGVQKQPAPCGRVVDVEYVEDRDEDCLVTEEFIYSCGCRIIGHEYHDGTVSRRVVRHDGKVLTEQLEAEHEHHR